MHRSAGEERTGRTKGSVSVIEHIKTRAFTFSYHVEFSDSLAASAWQSADGLPASVSPGPSAGYEKVRVALPQAPGGKRFYRLRLELAE